MSERTLALRHSMYVLCGANGANVRGSFRTLMEASAVHDCRWSGRQKYMPTVFLCAPRTSVQVVRDCAGTERAGRCTEGASTADLDCCALCGGAMKVRSSCLFTLHFCFQAVRRVSHPRHGGGM